MKSRDERIIEAVERLRQESARFELWPTEVDERFASEVLPMFTAEREE